MGYWLAIWTKPRLLLTAVDEMAIALEILVVLSLVFGVYWFVSQAIEGKG